MAQGGHLYMQTNEIRNCIIHYHRAPDGTITEVGRIFTGGAGGLVVISGTVRSWAAHDHAMAAVWSAPGVTQVDDRLRIENAP